MSPTGDTVRATPPAAGDALKESGKDLMALISRLENPDAASPQSKTPPTVEARPPQTREPSREEVEAVLAQEAAPQEDATDDQGVEDEPPPPRRFRVKVDEEYLEVDEDELLRGYSRTAHFTRKSQEQARREKAFAEHEQAVRAERATLAQKLKEAEETLKALAPQQPNWERLRAEDPLEYAKQAADWNLYNQALSQKAAERQAAEAKVREDQARESQARLAQERELLLEAIPSWKDASKANAELQGMVEYAKSKGLSDAEMAPYLSDHRAVLLLREAWQRGREAQKRPAAQELAQQKVQGIKAASPGGASQPRRPADEYQKDRQRLQKAKPQQSVGVAADIFSKLGI